MNLKRKTIVIVLSVIIIMVACKSALKVSKSENVDIKTEQTKVLPASELYASKCSRCHKLFEPQKYSKTEWTKWVDKMASKAKLTTEEKDLIIALN